MKKSEDTREMLVSGNIVSTMLTLSIPAILGMVVIGLYNFMDAVFVGQMVNATAMTAVKVSYPFTLLNSGVSTLIGVGSSSLLSIAIGKKDKKTIDGIMGNLMALIGILSVIVMVVGLAFTPQLLSLSGAKGDILNEAVRYLRIVFCGSLFVNFAQSANMVMRGEGKLKKAMTFMAIGAILNIILDPIMITIVGKENGVTGAAFATIISQFVQACITLYYFLNKSEQIKIGKIGVNSSMVKPVLSVGVSAMMMQVLQMVQQTIMYNTVESFGGSSWQTILGASLSLQAFAFIPLWGISQGFQPAIGTNYGAKKYDRMVGFNKAFMIAATIIAAVFYIPIMCFPDKMLSMFIKDASDVVVMGAPMLRILFATYISYGVMILAITFFQAIGKGSIAAILTLLRQVVLFIPLVILLPRIKALGVGGVFFAQTFTDIVVMVMVVIFMTSAFAKIRKELSETTNPHIENATETASAKAEKMEG
ncbi:MATE family efflux transporter [Pseudobutyrivibrio ruminis]|uniref:Multidrug export protein MepA n=1 Tax=Pseudobutyrivibrio ruminis TaxID=46206 RepID=A0A2G3E756_9FIRM|nr:MATE family efflux transporter [Pseudobutyrivibrio ruminis]PHU39118.1 MATE family efflux transporter [Pseudobutyrivibrio ruminis]